MQASLPTDQVAFACAASLEGHPAPDISLPSGGRLTELLGAPTVLLFSPPGWDPGQQEMVRVFNEVARGGPRPAKLVELRGEGQHVSLELEGEPDQEMALLSDLNSESEAAEAFGVSGRHAVFVLDEAGIVRWEWRSPSGESPRTGQVLAALEKLNAAASPKHPGALSRRTFLASALGASVALLAVSGHGWAAPAPDMMAPKNSAAPADAVPCTLKVNGTPHTLRIEPRVTLLDALRENLGLTGTKKGCDHGQCGACTVHVDGQRSLSCLTLALMNQGRDITTIEGLSSGGDLHPMQQAFLEHDGFQCGYCTPGQIMSAVAMLREGHARTDGEIREAMSGNLCRCAAYPNIIAAIKAARAA